MTSLTFLPIRQEISSITRARPGVVTTVDDHGYEDGIYVRLELPEGCGMQEINGNVYQADILSDTTFSIDQDTSLFTPFFSGESEITGITRATNAVVTISNTGFSVGDIVYIYDVAGMTEINGNYYRVMAVSGSTITLNINNSSYGTYTSGGTVVFTQRPQVIPVGEISSTLENAERNNLTPIGGN